MNNLKIQTKDTFTEEIRNNSSDKLIISEHHETGKEIKFLRKKVDKFGIWKEELPNVKEIAEILNRSNKRYALQLKENNYLLWKFKRKCKCMEVISVQYNTVEYECKFNNRKKKREKLNTLANLCDIDTKLIRDCNFHQIMNQ
jgi:hypothetical protein